MNILVTGSNGFIGRNIKSYIQKYTCHNLFEFNKNHEIDDLNNIVSDLDFVFHLAGVNRVNNNDISLFHNVNVELTRDLCQILSKNKNIRLLYTSSKQANLDNDYGVSKRKAEDICYELEKQYGNKVIVLRLPGIFGPGCKPNYNSVVATFCFKIANQKEIRIFEEDKILELIYVNDLSEYFLKLLNIDNYCNDKPILKSHYIKVIELANLINNFKNIIDSDNSLEFGNKFEKDLYQTFISYKNYK